MERTGCNPLTSCYQLEMSSLTAPSSHSIPTLVGKSNFLEWHIAMTDFISCNPSFGDIVFSDANCQLSENAFESGENEVHGLSSNQYPAPIRPRKGFVQDKALAIDFELDALNLAMCRVIRSSLALNVVPFVRQYTAAKDLWNRLIWLFGEEEGINSQGGPPLPYKPSYTLQKVPTVVIQENYSPKTSLNGGQSVRVVNLSKYSSSKHGGTMTRTLEAANVTNLTTKTELGQCQELNSEATHQGTSIVRRRTTESNLGYGIELQDQSQKNHQVKVNTLTMKREGSTARSAPDSTAVQVAAGKEIAKQNADHNPGKSFKLCFPSEVRKHSKTIGQNAGQNAFVDIKLGPIQVNQKWRNDDFDHAYSTLRKANGVESKEAETKNLLLMKDAETLTGTPSSLTEQKGRTGYFEA